jgi:Mg-chelatase subunit ChlD
LIVNQVGAWKNHEFKNLIRDIKKQSFAAEKIKVLQEAISNNNAGFNSKQVIDLLKSISFSSDMLKIVNILDTRILGMTSNEIISILDTFSFSADKLKALKALKDTITDVENKYVILKAFSFSGDKEKARLILENIKPRSLVYGMIRSKNIVFVVDISGSMEARFITSQDEASSRLSFVTDEIKKVLNNQLNHNNNFNILVFNNKVTSWKSSLVKANRNNIDSAIKFLDNLAPMGGTNIYDSLKEAINIQNVETVYFLTDGLPTAGQKTNTNGIINDLKSWNKDKKVIINATSFLIGKFSGDNEAKSISLMKSIAEATNGVYRGIDD